MVIKVIVEDNVQLMIALFCGILTALYGCLIYYVSQFFSYRNWSWAFFIWQGVSLPFLGLAVYAYKHYVDQHATINAHDKTVLFWCYGVTLMVLLFVFVILANSIAQRLGHWDNAEMERRFRGSGLQKQDILEKYGAGDKSKRK